MKSGLILFVIAQLSAAGCRDVTVDESYEIKNQRVSRTISYSKRSPGALLVITKDHNGVEVSSTEQAPYFEFVINDQFFTANDPIWQLSNTSTRLMGNGGTEHLLTFLGSGKLDGLEISLYQQVFPGSTLIRERLELRNTGTQKFQLNKWDGALHFKFPQYQLSTASDKATATEIKLASWEDKPITFNNSGERPKGNHMFYPVITGYIVSERATNVKGPINILNNGSTSWISTYEHASQDDTRGLFKKQPAEGSKMVDAMQGVKGAFDFLSQDEDFKFLGISCKKEGSGINVSVDVVRGGYLDGEEITHVRPYSTVWTAAAFYDGSDLEDGKALIRNYLFNQICEKPASRKPEFYYNTWGMQREISREKPQLLRGCFTYETIFEEIDRAAQLGIDLFVLDDGWEQTQGIWRPHNERLPEGLGPIKKYLDQHDIKMGIWLSPMGIDSTTERYKQHQDWVIKDSEGKPILAQWNHPAFDFVGPFFDVFIEDCKWLIDEGARFFKWDAINTFYSTLPNLHHGTDSYSKDEIRARYEYLLPIYVTRAMEILTDYEPDLVIEIDLTEARRVMMGLAPMSQGKLFFMNNGASWYNDYSAFRTQSMRTIPNEYNGLIPLELFTFATYPHNLANKLDYNVNTSLIAGHGFWGNLALMTEQERLAVGKKVQLSKRVLPFLTEVNTRIEGKVGDSPEVYVQLNEEESAGQIFVFANENVAVDQVIKVNKEKFLAVLGQPFVFTESELMLSFNLQGSNATDEAFVLPNNGNNISITSSTCGLEDALFADSQLTLVTADAGELIIRWGEELGEPILSRPQGFSYDVSKEGSWTEIVIQVDGPKELNVIGNSK